jgi:hypothetical protein
MIEAESDLGCLPLLTKKAYSRRFFQSRNGFPGVLLIVSHLSWTERSMAALNFERWVLFKGLHFSVLSIFLLYARTNHSRAIMLLISPML